MRCGMFFHKKCEVRCRNQHHYQANSCKRKRVEKVLAHVSNKHFEKRLHYPKYSCTYTKVYDTQLCQCKYSFATELPRISTLLQQYFSDYDDASFRREIWKGPDDMSGFFHRGPDDMSGFFHRGPDDMSGFFHEGTLENDGHYVHIETDHGHNTSTIYDEDRKSVNGVVHLNDRKKSFPRIENSTSNNGFDVQRGTNWWKLFASSDHQVQDLQTLASPSKSRMALKYQKARYLVGDIVTVEIKVNDDQGHPKTKGGDYIRIWSKGTEGRGSMGTVVDNGDGTYVGTIKVLWAGEFTIKAKIVAQREQMVFIFQKIRQGNMSRQFWGEFKNESFTETVRCTGSLMLSHKLWKSSCNLTSMNNGLPWFCQRPVYLTCSSWASVSVFYLPKSENERITLKWTADKEFIPQGIHIFSQKENPDSDEDELSSVLPCNKVSPRKTWEARTPVGYAKKGRWFSTFCSSKFDESNSATKDCLKGRRMWMIGDSTVRQWFQYLWQKLSLQLKTMKWLRPHWYGFSLAEDHEGTFGIIYAVHGLPFYHGPQRESVNGLNATHLYIDSIPAESNDIVMVHFYLHFQMEHPEVLRMSVRKTVASLQKLKQRAPNTTLVVKGPHSFPFDQQSSLGDFWGNIVSDIYRDEFKSLQDDVLYLDLWEMTVATETTNRHPPEHILKMLVNYLLSFICSK